MQAWRSRPDTSRASGASPRASPTPTASAADAPSPATPATSIASRWTTFTHDASGGDRRRAADEEERSCAVRALYFDGCGLLATSDGGCVRLWSLERRRRICTLKNLSGKDELHAGGVSSIAIEGVNLLSGGGDGSLHLFDLEDLAPAASMRGHNAPISEGLLLPAGSHRARAVSSSVDGVVKLWDASGTSIADLLPPLVNLPPRPLPLALDEGAARGVPQWLFCGREGILHAIDLNVETPAAAVPLPGRAMPRGTSGCHALHIACAAAEPAPGEGVTGCPHLVASCSLNTPEVHIWDARLLPAAAAVDEAHGTFDLLSAASRRCLIASIPLPRGAACARQLHFDGCRLLVSVDNDADAAAFSRGAQSAALYDVRAASSSRHVEAPRTDDADIDGEFDGGGGRTGGCLLWQQPVPGDISCFQCRGERVLVGTATGAVHLWDFGRSRAQSSLLVDWGDGKEQPERKAKREKWRAASKGRGRFPKTQGFSNMKGFR